MLLILPYSLIFTIIYWRKIFIRGIKFVIIRLELLSCKWFFLQKNIVKLLILLFLFFFRNYRLNLVYFLTLFSFINLIFLLLIGLIFNFLLSFLNHFQCILRQLLNKLRLFIIGLKQILIILCLILLDIMILILNSSFRLH